MEYEKGEDSSSPEDDEENVALVENDEYTKSLTETQKESKIKEGLQQGCLLIMGLLALGIILIYLAFILEPLVLSRFLLYIFQPFINLLIGKKPWPLCKVRFRWPRWLAVTVVLIALVLIFALLGIIIAMTVKDMVDKADYYKERFNELKEDVIKIAEGWGYSREDVENMIPEINWSDIAATGLNYLQTILTQAILVMLIVVYMLLGYDGSNKSTLRSTIDYQIRQYILIHSAISVVNAVLAWVILWWFGVDFAVFWALLTFLLNYIPNIGSVLATVLPLPFVLFKEDYALWELVAVAVILTLLQFVLGQVLEPKLLGDAMEIPPITVIVALLFWGSIWGLIGAIFSVPLTVAIRLYLESVDHPAPKVLAGIIVGDFSYFDTGAKANPIEKKNSKEKKQKDAEIRGDGIELEPIDEALPLSKQPTSSYQAIDVEEQASSRRYDPEERYKNRYPAEDDERYDSRYEGEREDARYRSRYQSGSDDRYNARY